MNWARPWPVCSGDAGAASSSSYCSCSASHADKYVTGGHSLSVDSMYICSLGLFFAKD